MFGALRAAAQSISYEIAMGFALVGVMMAANSLNFQAIVLAQDGGFWHWYWLPLLPLFLVFWISGIAETNRAPFDVAEGESEIVAGFNVEYSGVYAFALFFFAEYASMILISTFNCFNVFRRDGYRRFRIYPLIFFREYFFPGYLGLFGYSSRLVFSSIVIYG